MCVDLLLCKFIFITRRKNLALSNFGMSHRLLCHFIFAIGFETSHVFGFDLFFLSISSQN